MPAKLGYWKIRGVRLRAFGFGFDKFFVQLAHAANQAITSLHYEDVRYENVNYLSVK